MDTEIKLEKLRETVRPHVVSDASRLSKVLPWGPVANGGCGGYYGGKEKNV